MLLPTAANAGNVFHRAQRLVKPGAWTRCSPLSEMALREIISLLLSPLYSGLVIYGYYDESTVYFGEWTKGRTRTRRVDAEVY